MYDLKVPVIPFSHLGVFEGRNQRRKIAPGVGVTAGATQAHVFGGADDEEVETAALGSLRARERL